MVRLHPACLRKPSPALRLVSGRTDGIRHDLIHGGIAPATRTGSGTRFRRLRQPCSGCRLQAAARLRAFPTTVDGVTTGSPEPRRARGRTVRATSARPSLARVMQYGWRAVRETCAGPAPRAHTRCTRNPSLGHPVRGLQVAAVQLQNGYVAQNKDAGRFVCRERWSQSRFPAFCCHADRG
jgi:hypothetical protein